MRWIKEEIKGEQILMKKNLKRWEKTRTNRHKKKGRQNTGKQINITFSDVIEKNKCFTFLRFIAFQTWII